VTGTRATSPSRCRIVVLISGRGSNLRAIIDAVHAGALPAEICAVISNRPQAEGLQHARTEAISTDVIDHNGFPDRASFDEALMERIDRYRPDLVVLAGFMRVLGAAFIDHYAGRLINIHPSLLPAFPGLHTHEQALASGTKTHGATVHFVTHAVDSGPIIAQAVVPVRADDTPASLAARVLQQEHTIYPLAIRWFAEGRLTMQQGKVLLDGRQHPLQGLMPKLMDQEKA
jgi:phosphoribosylglycinamide formyltransferase 1